MTYVTWHDEQVVGGIFETIQVEGKAVATSSIEANELSVEKDASLTIEGQLNVPYLKVEGELIIEGTLETNELSIGEQGYLVVQDDAICESIVNRGTIDLRHGLKTNEIHNKGAFIGMGQVKASAFHSKGSIRLDNELNAEDITITVAEMSNIRYIVCDALTVKAEREKLIFKDEDSLLTVREIDAVNANVENVVSDLLRADNVDIHKNCSIKVVEFVNDYQYNEASDVLEFTKITRN
ncbi:hypothetical protein [Macrococcus capreoli]|uniref:hypothetical protein n=1 Tax=Macrococcus capreoli TaxID=2982690 RepID=UPI0021D60D8C|nr:hypothetical protein [Macrococcus sp. TMW 2.2395]MCU7557461.1 hypothetical protein [Macrococcus sp. TMW 2.2395]